MRKVWFVDGHFYHVFNRGVDKRKIFLEEKDYYRFIHDLFEFNDLDAAVNPGRRVNKIEGGSTSNNGKIRKLLVEIVSFCLMPNHFHLILKQTRKEGVIKFMQKLGTGYTMYFNQKNERTGSLFGNRFKAVLIEKDEYLTHLSRYIHLNPVELIQPDWKEKGINNWVAANKFLAEYRWSSYPDYIGKRNFPSVINKSSLLEYFRSSEEHKKFVAEWLTKDYEKIKEFAIE